MTLLALRILVLHRSREHIETAERALFPVADVTLISRILTQSPE